MIRKPVNELQFVHVRGLLPTVEIDLDSLPDGRRDYTRLVESALIPLAASDHELLATVYLFHGPSVSFGNYGHSAFFACAGHGRVPGALYAAFHGTAGLRVRHGQTEPAQAPRQYHLEDGRLWCADEEGIWCIRGREDEAAADDASDAGDGDADGGGNASDPDNQPDRDPDEEWPEEVGDTPATLSGGRTELPARFRAARSDASVGTICRRIEEVFGLPEGAVALRGPDKKTLRSDATIRTLRRRWE